MISLGLWTAVALYVATAAWHLGALLGRWRDCRWGRLFLGAGAVLVHGAVLYAWIDIGHAQNLTWANLLSLYLWLAALMVLCVMPFRKVDSLNVFIYPLAAISLALALIFPEQNLIDSAHDTKQLVHILIAILSFSVWCLAALQALWLSVYDRLLRSRYAVAVRGLPALDTMERVLIFLIRFGFVLLTILLLTTLWWFDVTAAFRLKLIMASVAWVLFAILLLGRWCWHWRGRRLIDGTLLGMLLLTLAYFGTRMIAL